MLAGMANWAINPEIGFVINPLSDTINIIPFVTAALLVSEAIPHLFILITHAKRIVCQIWHYLKQQIYASGGNVSNILGSYTRESNIRRR